MPQPRRSLPPSTPPRDRRGRQGLPTWPFDFVEAARTPQEAVYTPRDALEKPPFDSLEAARAPHEAVSAPREALVEPPFDPVEAAYMPQEAVHTPHDALEKQLFDSLEAACAPHKAASAPHEALEEPPFDPVEAAYGKQRPSNSCNHSHERRLIGEGARYGLAILCFQLSEGYGSTMLSVPFRLLRSCLPRSHGPLSRFFCRGSVYPGLHSEGRTHWGRHPGATHTAVPQAGWCPSCLQLSGAQEAWPTS